MKQALTIATEVAIKEGATDVLLAETVAVAAVLTTDHAARVDSVRVRKGQAVMASVALKAGVEVTVTSVAEVKTVEAEIVMITDVKREEITQTNVLQLVETLVETHRDTRVESAVSKGIDLLDHVTIKDMTVEEIQDMRSVILTQDMMIERMCLHYARNIIARKRYLLIRLKHLPNRKMQN